MQWVLKCLKLGQLEPTAEVSSSHHLATHTISSTMLNSLKNKNLMQCFQYSYNVIRIIFRNDNQTTDIDI